MAMTMRVDDEQALHDCLRVLRQGNTEDKIGARWYLARTFEGRGMYAEAVELLENNVRAGVRDRGTYARLSALYRRLGRNYDADAALAEAHAGSSPRSSARSGPRPATHQHRDRYAPQPAASSSPSAGWAGNPVPVRQPAVVYAPPTTHPDPWRTDWQTPAPAPYGYQPPPVYVSVAPQTVSHNQLNNVVHVTPRNDSVPFIVRLIYFMVFGWWVGPMWVLFGFFLLATVIGIPIGLIMLALTPKAFYL